MNKVKIYVHLLTVVAFLAGSSLASAQTVDTLVFGDPASESAHAYAAANSEIIPAGLLGDPARRLLPVSATDWQGGRMAFSLKVDPAARNYVTVRFSGDDVTEQRLMLYVDGRQIGYRHLGDYDALDVGTPEPFWNGRFFYTTTVLPLESTKGKTQIRCEIRAAGRIWGYGTNFEQYQKPMTGPSRGIYRIYSHLDPYFAPPAVEKQGGAPGQLPTRVKPGAEVLDRAKERVEKYIASILKSQKPLNQMQLVYLTTAYLTKWTSIYRNPDVVDRIVDGLDEIYRQYRANPKLAIADPATPNADWFALGPSGQVISLLGAKRLGGYIGKNVKDLAGDPLTRRAAWTEMLIASRDYHKRHRRLYTNQTMISDMYVYQANRGVAVLDPSKADPEDKIRRYLYESVGLEPWRDSDPSEDAGAAEVQGRKSWGVGGDYWQLTRKGLTRELGYVGSYGEVVDWVGQIYDATRPSYDEPGDPKIKAQLEKIVRARSYFRFPSADAEGFRAMRLEQVVGWRDNHFPGDVVYSERPTWDASTIYAAALTLDAESIGHVRQMFDDNQFFKSVETQMATDSLRSTQGLLKLPEQYELIRKQSKAAAARLPMSDGQPDFVFSDEEDGVVAVRNGDEVLYASLYWRARHGINFLGRVHFMTPRSAWIATVGEEVAFEPSGLFFTRPEWTNFGFANGGVKYPANLPTSAHTGEKLPIAKMPADVQFKPGDESVYAGRGDFYRLRYGRYLIAMNMSKTKSFTLAVPADFAGARELVSKKPASNSLPLEPLSTVVLYK